MKCNIPKRKPMSNADRENIKKAMLDYMAQKIKEQNEKEKETVGEE